jgi:hypothetical protein
MSTTTHSLMPALLTLCAALTSGCEPEFDDDHQYLLKKPELLSIVLEPPVVAPGESTRASLLFADAGGAKEPGFVAWLRGDPLATMGAVDPASLSSMALGSTVELRAPQAADCVFDERGRATMPLSLLVQVAPLPAEVQTPQQIINALPSLIARGVVKLATRTLQIQREAPRGVNPRVASVALEVDGEGARREATLVRHDAPELAAARALARSRALRVTGSQRVQLAVEVAPPSRLEELALQWISTGGDLKGRRLPRQPFEVPAYVELGQGSSGPGQATAKAATDPNLYVIWLILRDDPATGRLGQSWVELYLRVVDDGPQPVPQGGAS